MVINPAIVISAYNRPESLKRLLASITHAFYESNSIDLIISIDKNDSKAVIEIAEQFAWVHGQKKIISHSDRLGLKKHILCCGDLALEYGAIILLEDDLLVSPHFYSYAKNAQRYYENDTNIAGISLYNYQVAESCFYPFTAIDDGADVYFMQVASSWGQLWTEGQWQRFKDWYHKNPELPTHSKMPAYLNAWGEHSWKKHFIHYLVDTNKYFVFPRTSLSTNFEDAGTNAATKHVFQVPLLAGPKDFQFSALEKSHAVYDAWFEIQPGCLNTFNDNLKLYHYVVDLYGTKLLHALDDEYALTSQKATAAVLAFGNDLSPLELNVAMNLSGNSIALYKIKGNTFTQGKLNAASVLAAQNKEDLQGITIVIPIKKYEAEKVHATLASIAGQDFENKECILVCSDQDAGIENTIRNYKFPIKIVYAEKQSMNEALISAGFKKASKGILTWIASGNTFAPQALANVASAFRSNSSVCWIRGVNEDLANYEGLNVRSYRLTAAEAYKCLQKGSLNCSIEQNFFKKHCLAGLDDSLKHTALFFKLLQIYQLHIVVTKLGSSSLRYSITSDEQKKCLAAYSHTKKNNSLLLSCVEMLITSFFPTKKISQWFYPVMANFPDVLRHDPIHKTFYFSKY